MKKKIRPIKRFLKVKIFEQILSFEQKKIKQKKNLEKKFMKKKIIFKSKKNQTKMID